MSMNIIAWNFWSQPNEQLLYNLMVGLFVICFSPYLIYMIYRFIFQKRIFRKRLLKEFPDAHLFFKDQDAIEEIRRQIKNGNHKEALSMLEKLKLSEVTPFAYKLAHFYAMLGDYSKCREYLEISSEAKMLPSKRTVKKEKAFKAVSDKAWFDALSWGQKYYSSDG